MRFGIFGQVKNRVGSIADFGYTLDYELARDFCEAIVEEAEGRRPNQLSPHRNRERII